MSRERQTKKEMFEFSTKSSKSLTLCREGGDLSVLLTTQQGLYDTIRYCKLSLFKACSAICLQCFDTVGWAAGRASSLLDRRLISKYLLQLCQGGISVELG